MISLLICVINPLPNTIALLLLLYLPLNESQRIFISVRNAISQFHPTLILKYAYFCVKQGLRAQQKSKSYR